MSMCLLLIHFAAVFIPNNLFKILHGVLYQDLNKKGIWKIFTSVEMADYRDILPYLHNLVPAKHRLWVTHFEKWLWDY